MIHIMANPARGLLICTTIIMSRTFPPFVLYGQIYILILLFALKYGILGIFTRSDTKDTKACLQENTIIHNRNIKISIHEL